MERGILCSVTAMSVVGRFGRTVQAFTLGLLTGGLVHNISSDAHDATRRPSGFERALACLGRELAVEGGGPEWFINEAPRAILGGWDLPARAPLFRRGIRLEADEAARQSDTRSPDAVSQSSRGDGPPLRVQLWSYNYDPEPTGIGPVSKVLAEGLMNRGHQVDVVAAHPHYPEPRWGVRRLPYRETRNGIAVLRLPLWVGRATTGERYRQELTYMASQFAALPALGRPDVLVSTSPSFPALLPAIVNARARRLPWALWLQDILPDGAASTGVVKSGRVVAMARQLERAAYREADSIAILSRAFIDNLTAKGVPRDKLEIVHNPATRTPANHPKPSDAGSLRVLGMGNIGFSQRLAPLVEAFERSPTMRDRDVRLIITGNGVAAEEVRAKITSPRVQMLGIVDDERLETELQAADIALVSQQYEGAEWNIPSKLMNFMAYGLPVLAAVNPVGEVARIVEEAGAGWVVDSSRPESFPDKVAALVDTPDELAKYGRSGAAYADRYFTQEGFIERFEDLLRKTIWRSKDRQRLTTDSRTASQPGARR